MIKRAKQTLLKIMKWVMILLIKVTMALLSFEIRLYTGTDESGIVIENTMTRRRSAPHSQRTSPRRGYLRS